MVTKLQYYSELSEDSTMQLTKSRENWTSYLDTASRLYKYPFDEQVMIYAQRPNATACATLETWNKPMNRYVKRGSKGIALIDYTSDKPSLKYVFDYADTEDGRRNPKRPFIWELKQEHEAPVIEALAKTYGDMEGNLSDILYNIASELANDYYNDNVQDIQYSVENSYISEYDEYSIGAAFRESLTISTAYSLMSRCGLDTSEFFEDEDFNCIFDFNTSKAVHELGAAVSNLSEQVLREVEITIKKYERQKTAERSTNYGESDVYQERRLSDTGFGIEGATGNTHRQVRPNEENVPDEPPQRIFQPFGTDGTVIPAFARNRANGEQAIGAVNDGIRNEEPTAGQSDRSDGVGSTHEQLEGTSGGIYTERTDIQLENLSQGAEVETAPFSMAELAKFHSDWNEYLINGVVRDETVINAALNSDKENTLIEIESAVKSLHFTISQDIINSTTIKNKSSLLEELENYFTKDRKPPLTEQLYIAVISSEDYKSRQEMDEITAPTSPTENGSQFGVNFSDVQSNAMLSEILEKSGISLDTVDSFLRDGSGKNNSVLRVAAHYMKGKTPAENTEFLKQEYRKGGKGLRISGERFTMRYDETGIILAEGPTALHAVKRVQLSWEQVESRVRELIYDG